MLCKFAIISFLKLFSLYNIFQMYSGRRRDYIIIMKTTFLKFWLLTNIFRITSLQVIKEKLF